MAYGLGSIPLVALRAQVDFLCNLRRSRHTLQRNLHSRRGISGRLQNLYIKWWKEKDLNGRVIFLAGAKHHAMARIAHQWLLLQIGHYNHQFTLFCHIHSWITPQDPQGDRIRTDRRQSFSLLRKPLHSRWLRKWACQPFHASMPLRCGQQPNQLPRRDPFHPP